MKRLLAMLLLVLSTLGLAAPAAAGDYLTVVNRGSGNISIIRVSDNRLMGLVPIPTTGRLDDIAATPDGQILILNAQIDRDDGPSMNPRGEIIALSTRTRDVLWRREVGGIPHHITVSADGREVFVPLFDRQRMVVLDTATGTERGTMFAKLGMHTTRLSEDGRLLYAGSIFTGQIYVFDVASRALVRTLNMAPGELGGIGVRPFAVSGDDSTIYAQTNGLHGFMVLDAATNRVTRIVRHGDLPTDFEYPDFPYNVDHGLELSPDGQSIVAVSEATRRAYIYSTASMTLRATIEIGRIPKWVVFSRGGSRAFASNSGDGTISVISMESMTEVARVTTGGDGGALMKVIGIPDENIAALVGPDRAPS
jgi:DNA-binding beta-propeller fold protein YncE